MPKIFSYFPRLAGLFLLLCFCVGFRTYSARWNVTPGDATFWIKVCETGYIFPSSDLPSGDPAASATKVKEILQSIFDDYNNVQNSYVRLAPYPEDPDSPSATLHGDTPFNKNTAGARTIEICWGSQGARLSGGFAAVRFDGSKIDSCSITLSKNTKDSVKGFVSTVTHELGHCMGLDHPQENTHAIMSYFNNSIRLQDDDKMGLSFLYPTKSSFGGVKKSETATLGIGCSVP